MNVEMTLDEAQIVIAVLTFAEGAALVENPGIVEALKVLRPWRSALLTAYMRAVVDKPKDHATCVCGGGWTYDFAARRVYCKVCERSVDA